MTLVLRDKLAHGHPLDPIGVGARGGVPRALDTRTGRDVAIRLLPERRENDGGSSKGVDVRALGRERDPRIDAGG